LQNKGLALKYKKIGKGVKILLNISFFITIFSSIVWIFFCSSKISSQTFSQVNSIDTLYQSIAIYTLPLLTIWGIFALIKLFYNQKQLSEQFYILLKHLKNGSENDANTSSSKEISNEVALQEFSILLSDTNEILSDIIKRSNSVSTAQLEHLWNRTSEGERWLLAKTFIEINNFQSDFAKNLTQKAQKNTLLKGSILEFGQRYKDLHSIINIFDKQKLFYNMVEYGPLGKVYNILTPVIDSLYNKNTVVKETPIKEPAPIQKTILEEQTTFPSFLSKPSEEIVAEIEETSKIDEKEQTIAEGLQAIRDELIPNKEEKEFTPAPSIISFSHTQAALRNIKQQNTKKAIETPKTQPKQNIISLEELEKEINASPDNNYNELAYPFGAWKNEE
jgi:hypothetical protein